MFYYISDYGDKKIVEDRETETNANISDHDDTGSESGRETGLPWSAALTKSLTQPTTFSASSSDQILAQHHGASSGDTDTVASDDGLKSNVRAQLVSHFASHLSNELRDTEASAVTLDSLAGFLKEFSVLLDCRAQPGLEHRSTVFVRQQRSAIAALLAARPLTKPSSTDVPSPLDKFTSWQPDLHANEHSASEPPRDIDLSSINDERDDPIDVQDVEMPEAERFITQEKEYFCLVARLRTACTTISTGNEYFYVGDKLVDAGKQAEPLRFF